MQNENRLIEDFKYQTKPTIWKHLNTMAANYAVYSTRLNGYPPFLTDYDTYLYCTDTNMVIVCLDCCGHNEEQTYEESDTLSCLILEDGYEPRISMVWKLAEAVRLAKKRLENTAPHINVYGVLLTEADILNACDLYELWDKHDVTVIDELTRLKYKTIRVNEDDDLPCKKYVWTIIDATSTKSHKETIVEDNIDEFDRLLEKFLNDDMEVIDEDEPLDNANEDLPDDNEEDISSEEEEETIADVNLPSGVIEQNQNISVKVEILRPIANPREELDKLVGCTDIKRHMDELLALTSYNKMMQELFPNGKQHEVSLHSVFLGRPGTGKTTVCKIFGSLLRDAGALSKGHVVVCDRGTFIGTLWGDEERAMKQVLEMAKGGVLMIDEAYLLNGKHDHDPGKLVIQLLMNILADETQRDIAVVLCGYKEPMMKLLDSNPGLQSRFSNKFEFTDFTIEELLEITHRRVKDYEYKFTATAWEKYRDMMTKAYLVRNPETWGNARFISNQLERIYIQHAARCVRQRPKTKDELLLITAEDIVPIEMPRRKAKIGF